MIAVIDVCGNNLNSLCNAIERLGYSCRLTHKASEIKNARRVIIPGVGAAKTGMQALIEHDLVDVIRELEQPILGICLGMQLLFDYSDEGGVNCLKLIPGTISRMPCNEVCPIPHMGWNRLHWKTNSTLRRGLEDKPYVYFVHSYALLSIPNSDIEIASCEYSEKFTAIVQLGQVYGMQFHPEKSAKTGLTLLNNFLQREP